jgi:hypothetical protein
MDMARLFLTTSCQGSLILVVRQATLSTSRKFGCDLFSPEVKSPAETSRACTGGAL